MTWLRSQMRKGAIKPADTLGASESQLNHYFDAKVKPLIAQFIKDGPNKGKLKDETDVGFQSYLALALYAFQVLPEETFRRSLVLNQNETPSGFARAIIEATNERPKTTVRSPLPTLSDYWVPIGTGRVTGAKILEKSNGWAKIRATGAVSILSPVQD